MPILITALEADDWREVHAICTHPEVARCLDTSPFDPPESFQKRLTEAEPHRHHYQLAARSQGKLVGLLWLTLNPQLRARRGARFWLAVHPSYQRQGIGKKLLTELVSISDRWLDLLRLSIDVQFDHSVAIRLLTLFGFEKEVRLKKSLLRDGQLVDVLQFSRIRPGFYQPPEAILPPPPWPARAATPKAITIRTSTPDDSDAFTESFLDPTVYWGTFQLPHPPRSLWKKRLSAPSEDPRRMFVAEADGKIVGNLGLHGFQNPRRSHCWILGLGVNAGYQGMGIGEQLITHALYVAEHWLGAKRVELAVYADNTRAVGLYQKKGFEIEGKSRIDAFRDGAYVDSLIMGKLF